MTYITVNYTDMEIAKLKDIVRFKKAIGEIPKSKERMEITVNQSQMVGKGEDDGDLERRLAMASQSQKTPEQLRMEQFREKFIRFAQSLPLFKLMNPAEILATTTAQTIKKHHDGEELIAMGKTYDQLFYMTFGDICIVDTSKGGFSMEGIIDKSGFLNLKDYFSKTPAKKALIVTGSDIEMISFKINEAAIQKAPIAFLKLYKNLSELICKAPL